MSSVFDECRKMLVASETSIIVKYFDDWLTCRKVVQRVAKSVLLTELDEFVEAMSDYYSHYDESGTLIEPGVVESLLDNTLLDMMKDGLDNFDKFARLYIEEFESNRITLNKLMKVLYSFSHDTFVDMVRNADKGAVW